MPNTRLIYGSNCRFLFPLRNSTNALTKNEALTGWLSKDGGNFTVMGGGLGELQMDAGNGESAGGSGVYYVDLVASQTNFETGALRVVDNSPVAAVHAVIPMVTEPCLAFCAGYATGTQSASTVVFPSHASATNDIVNGATVEIVYGTGKGQVRTIYDYDGANRRAYVTPDWVITPVAGDSIVIVHPRLGLASSGGGAVDLGSIAGSAAAATALRKVYEGAVVNGQVSDLTPSTSSFAGNALLSAVNNFYKDMELRFTTGANTGVGRIVSSYDGATKRFTMTSAFPSNIANTDLFVLLAYQG